MILVDTSVWVDHLRRGNDQLKELLEEGSVLCHPFVIGELACGALRNRDEILALLAALPEAQVAEDHEVLHLVQRHRLHGRRLGWVDVHLLASALFNRSRLWTLDKPLNIAARSLKIDASAQERYFPAQREQSQQPQRRQQRQPRHRKQ